MSRIYWPRGLAIGICRPHLRHFLGHHELAFQQACKIRGELLLRGVNLLALLIRFSRDCRNRIWSAWIMRRSWAVDDEAVAVLRRQVIDGSFHLPHRTAIRSNRVAAALWDVAYLAVSPGE